MYIWCCHWCCHWVMPLPLPPPPLPLPPLLPWLLRRMGSPLRSRTNLLRKHPKTPIWVFVDIPQPSSAWRGQLYRFSDMGRNGVEGVVATSERYLRGRGAISGRMHFLEYPYRRRGAIYSQSPGPQKVAHDGSIEKYKIVTPFSQRARCKVNCNEPEKGGYWPKN